MHQLNRQAPEKLEGLRNELLAQPIGTESIGQECIDVRSKMSEYQAVGRGASDQMPAVYAHLQACSRCHAYELVLRELQRDRADWVVLSQQLRESERSAYLLLAEKTWRWVTRALTTPVALSRDDQSIGRRVGEWSLRVQPAGVRLADAPNPIALVVSLPGSVAQVNLLVIPDYQATEHAAIWHLRLELDRRSRVPSLFVAVGDRERPSSGSRTLSIDRPAEFEVEPPQYECYWLYFEWRSPQGEWKTERAELPLRSRAPEEPA
jgi:hypothetical protein